MTMDAYLEALALLDRAMAILDSLDEGVAAAHLSSVIESVQGVIASSGSRPD
jgi:hypothetical protein